MHMTMESTFSIWQAQILPTDFIQQSRACKCFWGSNDEWMCNVVRLLASNP